MSDSAQPGMTPGEARLRELLAEVAGLANECEACRADVAPHWQFCAHCGSRLATACPGCGSPLPPSGAHYCPHCGIQLPESYRLAHPSR